jgi:hypothetical protein
MIKEDYLGHDFKIIQNAIFSFKCKKCNIIAWDISDTWRIYDRGLSKKIDISCNEMIIKGIIE